MKFYQRRNLRKFLYPVIFADIFLMGFITIIMIGDFEFVNGGKFEKIFGGIFFGLFTLAGIIAYVYTQVKQVFKRKIEVTVQGIIYSSRNEELIIRWDDVDRIFLYPRFTFSYNRMIFFVTADCSAKDLSQLKISSRMIYSEFNDRMLELVKKYWNHEIFNESKYLENKIKKPKK